MLVSTEIHFRDNSGRFAAMMAARGAAAARALVEATASEAAAKAPVGPGRRDYARRPKLSSSVEPVMTGAKVGVIVVRAGHGAAQEHGAAAHWIPNAFGSGVPVLHPGNAAQPYVRPAIISMKGAKAIGIVRPFYT